VARRGWLFTWTWAPRRRCLVTCWRPSPAAGRARARRRPETRAPARRLRMDSYSGNMQPADVEARRLRLAAEKNCKDWHNNCPLWAFDGECEANASWMRVQCPRSCHTCSGAPVRAPLARPAARRPCQPWHTRCTDAVHSPCCMRCSALVSLRRRGLAARVQTWGEILSVINLCPRRSRPRRRRPPRSCRPRKSAAARCCSARPASSPGKAIRPCEAGSVRAGDR